MSSDHWGHGAGGNSPGGQSGGAPDGSSGGWSQPGGEQASNSGWSQSGGSAGSSGGWGQPGGGQPVNPSRDQPGGGPPADSGWGQPGGGQPANSAWNQPPASGYGTPSAQGPGGPTPPRPPRRSWPWIAGALGCVAILLIGTLIGGGVLWSSQRSHVAEKSSSTPEKEPFTSYGIGATPEGGPEQLIAGLSDNRYLDIRLSSDEVDCALPEIAGKIPADQLQSYLRAGNECLAAMWQGPMNEAGFDWSKPTVIAYDPANPASTECKDALVDRGPVYCFSENTIYWPTTAELYPSVPDPTVEQTQQMIMMKLSGAFIRSTYAQSGLIVYFTTLLDTAEGDATTQSEYTRRLSTTFACLASATAYSLPEGLRPSDAVADAIPKDLPIDSADPNVPARENAIYWLRQGAGSGGKLAACDTWSVSDDKVA